MKRAMMQVALFGGLSFDPFAALRKGCVTPERDVERRDVVQALLPLLVVVVIDKDLDLGVKIASQQGRGRRDL